MISNFPNMHLSEREAAAMDAASDRLDQPYINKGFSGRTEYLRNLSEDYGVPLETVQELADLLGPTEDFDGLVTVIQDIEEGYEWLAPATPR